MLHHVREFEEQIRKVLWSAAAVLIVRQMGCSIDQAMAFCTAGKQASRQGSGVRHDYMQSDVG